MYCMKCGEQIPDDSKFCGFCAHKLPVATAAPAAVKPAKPVPKTAAEKPPKAEPVAAPSPAKAAKQAQPKRKMTWKLPVWGWIAIAGGTLIVALVLIFTLGGSPTAIYLDNNCQGTAYVPANEELELHYGFWGVLGDDLIPENEAALSIWLYVNGTPTTGRLADPASTRDLECAVRQDFTDEEWNNTRWLHAESTVMLGPGNHQVRIIVSLTDEISDGYDSDGDGVLNLYEPGELYRRDFTIVASE